MKKLPYLTLVVVLLMAGASYVSAADEKGSSKQADHKEHGMTAMDEDALLEVGNKICPVSGEDVGEMGDPVKVEYKGKIYNLCCKMCKKDFNNNPEKYSKIAEEEVKQNLDEKEDDDDLMETGEEHKDLDHGDHD